MDGSEVGSTRTAGRTPDAVGQASLLVDAVGVVVRWSPAVEELLGHPARWGVGRTVTELLAVAPPGYFGASDTAFKHRDGHAVGCRIRVCAEQDPQFGACWRMDLSPAPSETVPAVDQALLEALFTRSPIGLFVLDPQLRLTRYNAAAQGMQGTRVTEGLGLRPTEAWPGFSSEMAEQVMAKVLETGEPAIAFEKRGRPPGDPDHEHVYSASVFRLEDPDGRIIGIADTVVDVSERDRAQQRLALVAEAGARIGTTLDVLRTAQELAEVVVPRLADSVAVELLEPVLSGHEVPHGPGRPDGPSSARPLDPPGRMPRQGCTRSASRATIPVTRPPCGSWPTARRAWCVRSTRTAPGYAMTWSVAGGSWRSGSTR